MITSIAPFKSVAPENIPPTFYVAGISPTFGLTWGLQSALDHKNLRIKL